MRPECSRGRLKCCTQECPPRQQLLPAYSVVDLQHSPPVLWSQGKPRVCSKVTRWAQGVSCARWQTGFWPGGVADRPLLPLLCRECCGIERLLSNYAESDVRACTISRLGNSTGDSVSERAE